MMEYFNKHIKPEADKLKKLIGVDVNDLKELADEILELTELLEEVNTKLQELADLEDESRGLEFEKLQKPSKEKLIQVYGDIDEDEPDRS